MDRLGPMLGVYSSGSTLAWNWIVEYLSSFPEIDTSIISRLMNTSPLLPEDIKKDTNERVALRCLEELFGPQNSLGSVTPPDSRVAIHPSRSCNDVLEDMLQEVPLSNLRNAGPELSRWDGHSFIDHKRATLPKCALEKLKDFIFVDIPVGGDENGPPPRSDEKSNQEDNPILPIPINEDLSTCVKYNHATENTGGEESSPMVVDKFIISSYSTRSSTQEPQFSFRPTFVPRRRIDPWTNDEEEMLRKGVQELTYHDGTVPWKRILEYGNDVFLRDRTATDLKNKWRSMCRQG